MIQSYNSSWSFEQQHQFRYHICNIQSCSVFNFDNFFFLFMQMFVLFKISSIFSSKDCKFLMEHINSQYKIPQLCDSSNLRKIPKEVIAHKVRCFQKKVFVINFFKYRMINVKIGMVEKYYLKFRDYILVKRFLKNIKF